MQVERHVSRLNLSSIFIFFTQDFEKALEDANKCIDIKPNWGKVTTYPVIFTLIAAAIVFLSCSIAGLLQAGCCPARPK
jgi:hypothetical protein